VHWDDRLRRRLKLRDLDTLLAVAHCGSMAKAAGQLSISQPAVSKAISDIERTLGIPLFDRKAQGVEPTLYGRALLKWAVAVFDDVKQGVRELEFLTDPTSGELSIGATEPIVAGMLPVVVGRLSQQHPRLVFQVVQMLSSPLYDELRQRRVDLIMGRILNPLSDDEFDVEVLFDDPQFVVAGIHNAWHRRRSIKLAELLNEPWTLPRPDSAAGSLVVESFRGCGLDIPRSNVVCNSIYMHSALLANGPHLAMFPRSLLHFSAERHFVKALPVQLPALPRPVGIITLKNRTVSPVTQLFIDAARKVATLLTNHPMRSGRRKT